MKARALIPVFCLLLMIHSHADTHAPPQITVTVSADADTLLRISPAPLEASYHAVATVFKYDVASAGYVNSARFPLRNPVAPVRALVSNGGAYVVTFDDHASVGRTTNVIVVYNGTGEVLKSWNLLDIFSADEMNALGRSVSSTHWRSDVYLLDRRSGPIVRIGPPTRSDRPAQPALVLDLSTLTLTREAPGPQVPARRETNQPASRLPATERP